MLSLEISQLRSTSRDSPARVAKSSRVRPARARPARNRFPVSLGIMWRSFHRWNGKHQYDKLHTARLQAIGGTADGQTIPWKQTRDPGKDPGIFAPHGTRGC